MSNKRIKELATLETVSPANDYLIIDPGSGGTKKIIKSMVLKDDYFC